MIVVQCLWQFSSSLIAKLKDRHTASVQTVSDISAQNELNTHQPRHIKFLLRPNPCDDRLVWERTRTNEHSPASNCSPFLSHKTNVAIRTSVIDPGRLFTKAGNGFSRACCTRHSALASSRKRFQRGPYQDSWSGVGPLPDALDLLALDGWMLDLVSWFSSLRESGSGRRGFLFFSWWRCNTSSGFEVMVYLIVSAN